MPTAAVAHPTSNLYNRERKTGLENQKQKHNLGTMVMLVQLHLCTESHNNLVARNFGVH